MLFWAKLSSLNDDNAASGRISTKSLLAKFRLVRLLPKRSIFRIQVNPLLDRLSFEMSFPYFSRMESMKSSSSLCMLPRPRSKLFARLKNFKSLIRSIENHGCVWSLFLSGEISIPKWGEFEEFPPKRIAHATRFRNGAVELHILLPHYEGTSYPI